ncbi:phosphotransferase family protein [Mycoplasmatota bacterium]|nr:phosphotransferase family protein [Mycoplasmatota bacterium]
MRQVTDLIKQLTNKEAAVESRLMGGMSNSTYIVTVEGEKHTFRIPGKKAEVFVDRIDELNNIKMIDDLGINNETVFIDLEKGYKLAKYVEGTPLHELDDLHLSEVAALLKKLHTSKKRFLKDYSPFERLESYESLNNNLSESYFTTKDSFLKYRDYLESFPLCMCHNDSQKSNIVIGDKNYLLDWEFAGNNDYYYDIACFGNVDYEDALKLLKVYINHEPTNDEYNRLTLWRAFQCLQWHNVALYKDRIGLSEELKVPFDLVATKYLEKANSLLSSLK